MYLCLLLQPCNVVLLLALCLLIKLVQFFCSNHLMGTHLIRISFLSFFLVNLQKILFTLMPLCVTGYCASNMDVVFLPM